MKRIYEGEFHFYSEEGWSLDERLIPTGAFEGKRVRITIETIDEEKIILCIFGSRSIRDGHQTSEAIRSALEELGLSLDDLSYAIEGGAPGADRHGKTWLEAQGVRVEARPARWKDLSVPGAVVRADRTVRNMRQFSDTGRIRRWPRRQPTSSASAPTSESPAAQMTWFAGSRRSESLSS